jgi:hypothetical protein
VLVRRALEWLEAKAGTTPAVAAYLQHWKPETLRLAQLLEMPAPEAPAAPDEAEPTPATAPAIPEE